MREYRAKLKPKTINTMREYRAKLKPKAIGLTILEDNQIEITIHKTITIPDKSVQLYQWLAEAFLRQQGDPDFTPNVIRDLRTIHRGDDSIPYGWQDIIAYFNVHMAQYSGALNFQTEVIDQEYFDDLVEDFPEVTKCLKTWIYG